MAKIDSVSYIQGIHGKVCRHSQDEFRTNSSSGTIILSKKCNPYQGDPTEKQTTQRTVFSQRTGAVRQWLTDNRAQYYTATDTEVTSGTKKVGDLKAEATALYNEALAIKKSEHLASITAALFLYQSPESPYSILLPSEGGSKHGGNQ